MEKTWKPVVGYEGRYEVSNLGEVRSLDRFVNGIAGSRRLIKGVLLKQRLNNVGYYVVDLQKNGRVKTTTLHKIVALAFLDNPLAYSEVDHINTIRTDNRIENLRYCSHKANQNNEITKNKMSESAKKKTMTLDHKSRLWYGKSKPVNQYTKDGEFIKRWNRVVLASESTGVASTNIVKCCKEKVKTAGGFIWRYA